VFRIRQKKQTTRKKTRSQNNVRLDLRREPEEAPVGKIIQKSLIFVYVPALLRHLAAAVSWALEKQKSGEIGRKC